MFDTTQFIAQCREALRAANPCNAVRDILARAVCEPDAIMAALGAPTVAGVQSLHQSDELTVLNVVWAPNMSLHPHNHEMWACIGIYCGREDNVFYRRSRNGLTQHGSKALTSGDTLPLGRDIIHGVSNPLDQFTGALHVYGGDFFTVARSEWDPQTLVERPYDIEHTRRVFREASQRLREPH
jgi:predicted metal-dependent enzyme (double-stranded beta helix superfamily)